MRSSFKNSFQLKKKSHRNREHKMPPFEFDFESILTVYRQRLENPEPQNKRWMESVLFLEDLIFEQIQGGKPFS